MSGFINGIVWGNNVNFDVTTKPAAGIVTTDGQLLIGATAAPHIRAGTLTSTGGSVTITPGPGTINLEAAGGSAEVSFSAHYSPSVTSVTGAGTPYIIKPNTVDWDTNSAYAPLTGTFTAPSTGHYHFDVVMATGTYTLPDTYQVIAITGGGSTYFLAQLNPTPIVYTGDGINVFTHSITIALTASDTVNFVLTVTGEASDTISVFGDPSPPTSIQGFKI